MQSAFIITDKNSKPYAVIAILSGGTEFYPIAESALNWASWMRDEYAARKITKEQIAATLDNAMQVDGPLAPNRSNKFKLDELIKKAKKLPEVVEEVNPEISAKSELVPVISLMDARLDYLENNEWRNAVDFKAKSFIADVNKSTFSYEVKRTRAAWDPSLSIPGTDRRGGWRCPPGTRNGGQITDRFGRNCGWGTSRRLANELTDLGERLENVGDKRRERRVNRRNERVMRRMQQGGRIERAARGVAGVLDRTDNEQTRKPRAAGLIERVAGRAGNALETNPNRSQRRRENRGEGPAGAFIRGFREGWNEGQPRRNTPNSGTRTPSAGTLPNGGQGIRTPRGATARPSAPQARPARPRKPRQPSARPAPAENPYVENLRNIDDRALEKQWIEAQESIDRLNNAVDTPRRDGAIGMLPVEVQRATAKNRLDAVNAELERRGMRAPQAEYFNRNNPRAPRQPRQPRQARKPDADTVSGTPVPAGPPNPTETLEQYKTRKYNEHQQRVREIREAGGRAGFLTRSEWDEFHGQEVESAYNKMQSSNGRNARRVASNSGAARSASRRPRAQDTPDAVQPPRRRRTPANRQQSQTEDTEFKVENFRQPPTGIRPHKSNRAEVTHGHALIGGILVPQNTPMGNSGINNKEDAIEHLRNGGSLDDVPDLLVKDAIFGNAAFPYEDPEGKRFVLEGDPTDGINNRLQADINNKTYVITDTVTNRKYIIKTPSHVNNEHVGEQIGEILGQVVGRPMPRVRIVGKVEQIENTDGRRTYNAPVLTEHFDDVISINELVNGYSHNNGELDDSESSKYVSAIDALLGFDDRHGGNILWADRQEALPIDHGILGRRVADTLNRSMPKLTAAKARQFAEQHPEAAAKIKEINEQQINAIVDSLVNNWNLINPDGLPDGAEANARALRQTLINIANV